MIIQQLSVFVENKVGRLAEITATIAQAGIDIRALSLADTTDFGILRLIVDKPDEAVKALKEAGMAVALTDVIAVGVSDKPGEFARTVRLMSDAGANIEYLYAFVSRTAGAAVVIFRVDHPESCIDLLQKQGIRLMAPEEVYNF